MVYRTLFLGFLFLTALCFSLAADKAPWQRRIAKDVNSPHKAAHERVSIEMWPLEPLSPTVVVPLQFASAFRTLCGPMPEKRLTVFTESLLANSKSFDIDPFLLAGLVFYSSECRPSTPDREIKRGVTRIDLDMHAPQIRGGKYRYFVKEGSDWVPRDLDVSKYPFNKWKAERIDSNLYFAAAILRVFKEQCSDLDLAFSSVAHRNPVSHWFFGDNVQSTGPENDVLTARRRMLVYYSGIAPEKAGSFKGINLVSPLDGIPRLVIDYFGNPREKKDGYGHRGIDINGTIGEPVRSIADGKVSFSGVDMVGESKSIKMTVKEANVFPKSKMGPGGLYIHINHGDGFGSLYMHLDSLAVSVGDEVKATQIIGTLGRTGTITSGPHLHLEIRVGTGRIDPAEVLSGVLVNPFRVQAQMPPSLSSVQLQ